MTKIGSLSMLVTLLALAMGGCAPSASPSAPGMEPSPTAVIPAATSISPTSTPAPSTEEAVLPAPPAAPLQISSSAFEENSEIPVQYTCDGKNLSPPLEWSGAPAEIQSLALLVADPDSQPPGFVHWVMYNLPPEATSLPEGVPAEATLADGTLQGTNDFALYVAEGETFPSGAPINLVGYDGPCPPSQHRYVFTLYALDTLLDLPARATMAEVLEAVEGHVLDQAELVGLYTPQR
jgi:Raf kinase inhibitor-like YbhB/YbcL family protein